MAIFDNIPGLLIPGSKLDTKVKAAEIANKIQWQQSNIPSNIAAQNMVSGSAGYLSPANFKNLMGGQISPAITKAMTTGLTQILPNIPKLGATNLLDETGGGNSKSKGVCLSSLINKSDFVFFNVMPSIAEGRSASYQEIPIAQHPGAILKYETTSARTWNIQGIMLISRNETEATKNQSILNLIRSWVEPYYGSGTEKSSRPGGKDMLGAPPDVLELKAYGSKNIGPVPVVLENCSITWPNNVDYISTTAGDPFPVILNIDLQLKESWSPREYSGFDLYAYKQGDMAGAYKPSGSPMPTSSSSTGTGGEGPPTPASSEIVNPTAEPNTKTAYEIQKEKDDAAFMQASANSSIFGPSAEELYNTTHATSNNMANESIANIRTTGEFGNKDGFKTYVDRL